VEVGGEGHAPAALSLGMIRWFGGRQGRYALVTEISPTTGFDLRTVQPIAGR